ncbi:MAG: hypothetical protein H6810_10700 [Phycisphaeraceae bacterium]|nr:MAG: hypothetical protein H6810_10700 [Phycisphaeraceae bacterium]
MPTDAADSPRLYDDAADDLIQSHHAADHVTLLPGDHTRLQAGTRIRIMWGQDMLRDVLDGRYRAVVCGVNDNDNSHGIIAQLVNLVATSQWSAHTVTSYARMFHESVHIHASQDREPYILKYDLDSTLVMAILRPRSQDHFTMSDLARGFQTITKMLQGRADRRPVCSVSFLGGNANRLIDADGSEPTFETVLRTMHESGFRGDVYPSPQMWQAGDTGVFASYPFPESVERMRGGSS